MIFYLIGTDYKTLPFEARENLYRQRKLVAAFWQRHVSQQAVMLVTCNRMEVYGIARDFFDARKHVILFERQFLPFLGHGYVVLGEKNVFRHVLRLACGLESQLKGEVQILQQLDAWRQQDSFPLPLADLAQKAIYWGQDIRSRSGLYQPEHNMASVVFEDLMRKTQKNQSLSVLILGTGKVAELFSGFHPENARLYFASNRNFSKAEILACYAKGEAVPWEEIPAVIPKMNAIIGATASPHFVLRADDVRSIYLKREKPLYVYDLAFPRDIEPDAGGLPGVVLKNLNDLHLLFEEYNSRVEDNIHLAEYLCGEALNTYPEREYASDSHYGHETQPLSR